MTALIGRHPSTVYATSEGQRFAADTDLVVVECATCGVTYAIPESFDRSARKYHGDRPNGWSICCPFGHTWHYCGETEIEKAERIARRAREQLAAEQARHDQTKASLRATKGVVTKTRKRVQAGVCPAAGCQRHFTDLQRHIASKHPSFGESPSL